MSNSLFFPVRIYDEDPTDILLMVPHDCSNWVSKATHVERTNQNRKFCNWIRKQFPDVPTEFRFVRKRYSTISRTSSWRIPLAKLVNCDKHFVVYGLTANQLMMIKLAWQFTTSEIKLGGTPTHENDYFLDKLPVPSAALLERLEKKIAAKTVSEL